VWLGRETGHNIATRAEQPEKAPDKSGHPCRTGGRVDENDISCAALDFHLRFSMILID
jgi:hypothetical protein